MLSVRMDEVLCRDDDGVLEGEGRVGSGGRVYE